MTIDNQKPAETPKLKPHKGFLLAASITVLAVIFAYMYQEDIVYLSDTESHMGFVTLIIMLLVLSIFFEPSCSISLAVNFRVQQIA